MMPTPARMHLRTSLTSAENAVRAWFLPIFVGLLSTNMVALSPALASDSPLTPIGTITKSMTNQDVTVQAAIFSIREPRSERAPYTVTLTESNATSNASVSLVYWSDMQPQLAPKVKTGNVIRANVTISVYRDRLQLRIKNPDAITLVSAAPESPTNAPAVPTTTAAATAPTPPTSTPTAPPAPTVIGKIKADWADRVVIISGTISGSEVAGNGRRLSVQDATGEISVMIRESVVSGLVATDLQTGRALTVTGPVKLIDGKPVIVPDAASAIKLLSQ
jgi:DNA/RNA endonuclease YhcR with UshA esterase domain